MQPTTQGVHSPKPACTIEKYFDLNISYQCIQAWQQASDEVQYLYPRFRCDEDEYEELARVMRENHCSKEYQLATIEAVCKISNERWFAGADWLATYPPELRLQIASYAQCKTFGTPASEGDLEIYFKLHLEDEAYAYGLMDQWRSGNFLPLYSLLRDRLSIAVEEYETQLKARYRNCALPRVEYREHVFVPVTEVLDTEYFLLLALTNLVEPHAMQ